MKRHSLLIAIFWIAMVVVAVAQTPGQQATLTTPEVDKALAGGVSTDKLFQPFQSFEDWRWHEDRAVGDILTNGIIDTALGTSTTGTYTFYGRVWSMSQTDWMPTVIVTGADSGIIVPSYRWIWWTGNTYAVSAWTAVGSVTIKTPTNSRDTLFIAGPAVAVADTNKPSFIQYKYAVTPQNATYGIGAKKSKRVILSGGKQQTWRGECGLVFRREDQ